MIKQGDTNNSLRILRLQHILSLAVNHI